MKRILISIAVLSVLLTLLLLRNDSPSASHSDEEIQFTDARSAEPPAHHVLRPQQSSLSITQTSWVPANLPMELGSSWPSIENYERRLDSELPNLILVPQPAMQEDLFSALHAGKEIDPTKADQALAEWGKPSAEEIASMTRSHEVGGRMRQAREQLRENIGTNADKYLKWKEKELAPKPQER
ncbi:MAG: hypothetical protein V4481_04055 [Patescibacteria group bacterium]